MTIIAFLSPGRVSIGSQALYTSFKPSNVVKVDFFSALLLMPLSAYNNG
jgi:hypothetical protein